MLAALAAEAARADPSFPAALQPQALRTWLAQATDVTPDEVVAVSPSALTAVMSRAATVDGAELLLRAEALTPQAVARTGLLSWEMRLDVNCRSGELRAGDTNGYGTRRAGGQPVSIAPTQSDWRRPTPGTALEAAWRAACDPHFRPPLAAALLMTPAAPARQAPSPAASATPPAPRPTPPAAHTVAVHTAAVPPPATPAAHVVSRHVVQVVSSPEEQDTRRGLERLRSRFPDRLAGLDTRIDNAEVRGHTVYRGMVAGFASRDDAVAFCQALRGHGQACVIR